jgi:uncharacterized protein YyaL (SSP411 family)
MHQNTAPDRLNHLAGESSPYLLQHAGNPVDWYPWGPEALAKARAENKPILLSIGYSACHWCHVMAHESFEDPATAALMNELFVNVKVDREERPDLDRIYQTAHQVLNQSGGGWPLTVFLAPETQHPFFTGTYFPLEPRYGMPPFKVVLQRVAEFYRTRNVELREHGERLVDVLGELLPPPDRGSAPLSRASLAVARAALQREFDGEYGGFGGAPKFPHPMNLEFLLRTWRASAGDDDPDLHALYMATLSLTRMAEGGLYDQLGGGFCRYSVDAYWMIPHFEKMLYDNGQLLAVTAQAAAATGEDLFRRVTTETANWLLYEMEHPEGGFYSTYDADSEGHEGKFYVWDLAEPKRVLAPVEYSALALRYGLDREPNFEGRWHLHAFKSIAEVATQLGVTEETATSAIDAARLKLFEARGSRVWPARDEKILTSWNGLAIAGLAAAARTAEEPRYAEAALRAVRFLREHSWHESRLLAVHKDGRSRFPAYLDDHAFLAWGLTELLQARWDAETLAWAIELAETMLAHFEDRDAGGFYFTADDHEDLILRPKTFGDDATPSGNGVAARALARLGFLLGETRYLDAAERTLRAAAAVMEKYPQGHTALLMALDELTAPPTIVVLRGEAEDLRTWRGELDRYFDPRRIVLAIPADASDLPPALADKKPLDTTVAYVCRGTTCSAPVGTLGELIRELKAKE